MRRAYKVFALCLLGGILLALEGWLVPAYLRAIPATVLNEKGRNTPSLVQAGQGYLNKGQPGPAQLLLEAAAEVQLPGTNSLAESVSQMQSQHPAWAALGMRDDQLEKLLSAWGSWAPANPPGTSNQATPPRPGLFPVTDLVVRTRNREVLLALLQSSTKPTVQELLRCRSLTNTVFFSPSASSSGQAFDTALALCGLLLEEGRLSPSLASVIGMRATAAVSGDSQVLEADLMDFLSLGQRFNWGQLTVFVAGIPDEETLRTLTIEARDAEGKLPVFFSAVALTSQPAEVASYLQTFSHTGLGDISTSFQYGAGGVRQLVSRQQRLYVSPVSERLYNVPPMSMFNRLAIETPGLAMGLKWFLYLAGGFLFAVGFHVVKPPAGPLEQPLQVRGFHFAREILFALGFLLVVLLLTEPFLAQESQKVELPFRFRLPQVADVIPVGKPGAPHSSIMNQLSLLTLLLFFVLQGLIYTACLLKLAEIRRQKVPPRLKIRLLENEEHLFDGGLYLGFVGTIISLILVSLGVIRPSLMAAYSSTSFGIIFVSIFKIFHLRPYRRTLLLEAEGATPEQPVLGRAPTLATTP